MQDAVPLADMENGAKRMGASEAIGLRLGLGGNKTLTIGEKDLVLFDPDGKNHKKSSNGKASSGKQLLEDLSCFNCLPSRSADGKGKHTIPLYNILWAELRGDALVVDYAAPRKSSLKLQKWTFAIPTQDAEAGGPSPESFVSALVSAAYGEAKPRKRAYVLINPNSGPGGALGKWKKHVKPLFEAARMELEVVNLSRGGEATELTEKADIEKYDTIMALSGDGTPFEIFNGLGRRPDAAKALAKIAVSHIPCGSGNAFSLNCNGSNNDAVAALAVVKGVVMPLDLVSVTQGDRRTLSFLSQTVGIIAESDLGTENLRWMGSTRFEVGLVTRVLKKKCYPFDLSVKVEIEGKEMIKQHYKKYAVDPSLLNVDAEAETGGAEGLPKLKYGTVQDEIPSDWETASHDNVGTFYVGNMAYMSSDANFFSAAVPTDGLMDMVMIRADISPVAVTKAFLSVETGKFFDNPNVTYKKVSAYRITPRNQESGYISIDGERIPFEPFQAEIHRGLGRVISKRGVYEAAGPAGWEKA
ncbi:sphingosine kinase [Trichoderma arundinaceum]|uniref:Sphingosine kinase n=1 Tax=Trichoderma arundinaceum TaxID=490622 RepID=A0A395NEV9_TRIAR|nr:sphingosine kinase [Trichoderma arundinaceum]